MEFYSVVIQSLRSIRGKDLRSRFGRTAAVVAIVLGVAFLTSCPAPEAESVKVGAVLPLTGPAATIGKASQNGLILAMEDINNAGGVRGRKLRLVIEDGRNEPRISLTAFRKLIQADGVRFIIVWGSTVSMAVMPVAKAEKVLLLAEAIHPGLTGQGPFVLRHASTALQEAEILLDEMSKIGVNTIGLLWPNDDYGRAFRDVLLQMSRTTVQRTRVVADQAYEREAVDFRTALAKLFGSKPEALMVIGFGSPILVAVRQVRELGFSGPVFTGTGLALTPGVEQVGAALQCVRTLEFRYESLPEAEVFRRRYQQRFGEKASGTAILDYSSLQILTRGIEGGGLEPAEVSSYLKTIGELNVLSGRVVVRADGDILSPLTLKHYP